MIPDAASRLRAAGSVAVLVVTGAGCTLVPRQEAVRVVPATVPEPAVDIGSHLPFLEPVHVAYLERPNGEGLVDEFLASPMLRDPEFQDAVAGWIDYWANAARPWFPEFLRRMGAFEQTVDSALVERGLPASLRYLPLIESGYSPEAQSHASAVGMWQFMSVTAREHGMRVEAFVDERRDPLKSTVAATAYLAALHTRFESWFLALAAYNGGPTRAQRILRQHARMAQPSDSLFWALRQHWPRETRDFVPKLVAAIIVAQDPGSHGYEPPDPDPPFRYSPVRVPEATTFDVLARAAETDETEIRRLNPELYRGFTPPGRTYELRVPEGRADVFETNYAAIPPGERMTVVEHAVQQGETLSHIAHRYGVSIRDLQAANPDIRPRYLRVGARLTVPILLNR
ncbi:MAG: transglycosylase SLT domain-containing protein [Longimicrobiales bacterium]